MRWEQNEPRKTLIARPPKAAIKLGVQVLTNKVEAERERIRTAEEELATV